MKLSAPSPAPHFPQKIIQEDSGTELKAAEGAEQKLGVNIQEPTENDVLCGRGAHAFHHVGNKRWKELTKCQAIRYYTSKRHEKRKIAECIVQQVHQRGGRFLRQDSNTGSYFELNNEHATVKTSQLFRDFRSLKEKMEKKKHKRVSIVISSRVVGVSVD